MVSRQRPDLGLQHPPMISFLFPQLRVWAPHTLRYFHVNETGSFPSPSGCLFWERQWDRERERNIVMHHGGGKQPRTDLQSTSEGYTCSRRRVSRVEISITI